MPGLHRVTATEVAPPPTWALMQRRLFKLVEDAGILASEKYARPDGGCYSVHDVDDTYESRSMRGIFYAMGGGDKMLEIAHKYWNSSTAFYNDATVRRPSDPTHPMFMVQLHNEYWNHAVPFNADWFHMGEGNQSFYDFGVADPTNPDMRRRANRFAEMYIGDDPEAPNYDKKHKIIRSPLHGSEGPLLHADVKYRLIHEDGHTTGALELVRHWLDSRSLGDFGHRRSRLVDYKPSDKPLVTPLHPIVKELEPLWFEDPARRDEIMKLFDDIVLNGDEPSNLCTVALVTNAYLYTGDAKYKKWVLEYTGAWLDRIKKNKGIIPDNIGPTGKIGEKRNGQWWGGLHGWMTAGASDRMFISITIAAELAHLLSGDAGYLEVLRSQIKVMFDNHKIRDDGQIIFPTQHNEQGWGGYGPMRPRRGIFHLAHLYHASFAKQDYDYIVRLREGEREIDWNEAPVIGDRGGAGSEYSRFQYYDGKNPDWPLKTLTADYQDALGHYEFMINDPRDTAAIARDAKWPPNPVIVKALIQTTMGGPQTIYNGGLNRGNVRYFDEDRGRPGLPPDVAALVDKLGDANIGIQLVNTSSTQTRKLIVQSGVFGEHTFTEVRTQSAGKEPAIVPVNGKYFAVTLPPSTSIRLDAGLKRFSNDPSYAFPWHNGKVPVI
ncbi:MAG: hypothetical protein FJ319_00795 [SAR202 cluster bacterium]|nr:hypothetical protein [SAR202 cluster bacterium]